MGPQRDPKPLHRERGQNPGGCLQELYSLSCTRRQIPFFPEVETPQSSPSSSCKSMKPQLSEPRRQPATAEVLLWGSPGEQASLRGHCITQPGSCRPRDHDRGSSGDTPYKGMHFHMKVHMKGLHSLQSPGPQSHNPCRDHSQGCFSSLGSLSISESQPL